MIEQFGLRDVRCFEGEQRAELRPITLLVGENSTGKTTFLGCYSVLHRLISRPRLFGEVVDFNREPFSMGSFRDIVRARRGRDGRIEQFKLAFTVVPLPGSGRKPYPLVATFSEYGSQPIVESIDLLFRDDISLSFQRGRSEMTWLTVADKQVAFANSIDGWMYLLDSLLNPNVSVGESEDMKAVVDSLSDLLVGKDGLASGRLWLPDIPAVVSIAPLRSKPKRTYDPVREAASPDGEHIPMLMMRLDRTAKGDWSSLHDHLTDFGHDSGLFSDIKVRGHGRQMSDPFQLQVKVRSGSYANIMDVGYGVSQSLPILVDVRRASRRTFLLQQPEVHLHPRAQASLAVLFAESWRVNKNRFLIETHSDYIVDRIRILVRKGHLKTNDVAILYFESKKNSVVIHNITLDGEGNLQNVPDGYRDFFLKETDRLLGFA